MEDERNSGEQARQVAVILERKRIALQAELDDIRSAVESVCLHVILFKEY